MQIPRIKIGTRGSPLALAQARETRDRLIAAHGMNPNEIEINNGNYQIVYIKESDQVKNNPKRIDDIPDFFRIPNNIPDYDICIKQPKISEKITCLEESMRADIQASNKFIPYIQQHEFESLIFSSSKPYTFYYKDEVVKAIEKIIDRYETPEDINDMPMTAPSKRLLAIIPDYSKVNDGNIIALEIGIETILQQCPRFKNWIETLVGALQ